VWPASTIPVQTERSERWRVLDAVVNGMMVVVAGALVVG